MSRALAARRARGASDLRAHLRFAAQRSASRVRPRSLRARSGLRRHRRRDACRNRGSRRDGRHGACVRRRLRASGVLVVLRRTHRVVVGRMGRAPIPYLAGVVCTFVLGLAELSLVSTILAWSDRERGSRRRLARSASLQDVRITDRDPSGRARAFELVADRGSATVPGSAFRRAVGSRVLPSLLLTTLRTRRRRCAAFSIDGGGLGHGVGLCQWGARGMALSGSSRPRS